jgi:hypothetical protein
MMLIDRDARGDCEMARRLLAEALDTYTQTGMHNHIEITKALIQ